jgi:hypothetical protein
VEYGRGSIRKWRNAGGVDTENGDKTSNCYACFEQANRRPRRNSVSNSCIVEGSVADGRDGRERVCLPPRALEANNQQVWQWKMACVLYTDNKVGSGRSVVGKAFDVHQMG